MENAIGWYHSHPGYGCWLSGIDVSTQMLNQQYQEPWVAIVVDPIQTMSAGKVNIGAFRTYPEVSRVCYHPPTSPTSHYSFSLFLLPSSTSLPLHSLLPLLPSSLPLPPPLHSLLPPPSFLRTTVQQTMGLTSTRASRWTRLRTLVSTAGGTTHSTSATLSPPWTHDSWTCSGTSTGSIPSPPHPFTL